MDGMVHFTFTQQQSQQQDFIKTMNTFANPVLAHVSPKHQTDIPLQEAENCLKVSDLSLEYTCTNHAISYIHIYIDVDIKEQLS